ncbi:MULTISPECIES: hypothetical protein [unclassified Mesorhizobium]|uniref:hypothetical protein n=1 Tax=unclassified Mesorhizobium TaxID=325217 RepID=UPI0015E28F5F|nr:MULTISPECIES: hypothetical protein [unclassified Mesorhizobium]
MKTIFVQFDPLNRKALGVYSETGLSAPVGKDFDDLGARLCNSVLDPRQHTPIDDPDEAYNTPPEA